MVRSQSTYTFAFRFFLAQVWAWGGLQGGEQSPIGNRQLACHHWWIVLSDMNSDWWIVVAGMGLRIVDGSWWYGDCGLEMENCAPTAVVPAKGPRIEATEGRLVTVLGRGGGITGGEAST